MALVLLILTFLGIAILEVPGLVRRRLWRELVAFSVLLTIGFVLSFLQIIGVKVPSPNKGIEFLIKTVAKAIMR